MLSQARAEWSPATRKAIIKDRRESKVAYRNAPVYTLQNVATPSNYASSPEEILPRNNDHFQVQTSPDQLLCTGFTDYFNVSRPTMGNSGFMPIIHQNFQDDTSWFSFSSDSYTLASNAPSSPHYSGGSNAQSPRSVISHVSTGATDMSRMDINSVSPTTGSDIMDIAISGVEFGSYDSFGSMLGPTPSTAASEFSEGFTFPPATGLGSPQGSKHTPDLTLTSEY